jgi:hypothetical protein
MARHFLQSTRPLVRVARNNIEIFATLAAMAAAAVVPLPSPSERGGGGRSGWTVEDRTNVRLTVAAPPATDSLAFNLVR